MVSTTLMASGVERSPLVIFISFSMPDKSIKAILDDGSKVNAPVVIRGLVDHSFKKTLEKIYSITKNPAHSIQIDPESFKRYGISQVPAYLLRENCAQDKDCLEKTHIIYGDIVLENVLQHFAHDNEGLRDVANKYIGMLRNAKTI